MTKEILLSEPASTLLDKFGAGKASPGSGSAAALMGVLAAKLLLTVSIKTEEKASGQAKIDRIRFIRERVVAGEVRLRNLFEQDARDFEQVIKLRRQRDRASTKAEQSVLSRAANDKLQEGTEPIFEIARECLALVDWGIALFQEGWTHVRGDSGAAISASISGAMACVFIASLNAKALRGRSYARKCLERCQQLTAEIQSRQSAALDCVASLSGEALDAVQLAMAGFEEKDD